MPNSDSVACAALRLDCDACWAAGCRFCKVDSGVTDSLDYACMRGDLDKCDWVLKSRPSTASAITVGAEQCSSVVWPTSSTQPTTTMSPTGMPIADAQASLLDPGKKVVGSMWTRSPKTWEPSEWATAVGPPGLFLLLLLIAVYIWWRWRQNNRRRVHVMPTKTKVAAAPVPQKGGGWRAAEKRLSAAAAAARNAGARDWDFAAVGMLSLEDLHCTANALTQSEEYDEARDGSHPRCLSFGAGNGLKAPHLALLGQVLDSHPAVSISFDMDWVRAADATLQALSLLVKRRGRCNFRVPPGEDANASLLRLSAAASCTAVEGLAEAVSVGAHAEVPGLAFEYPDGSEKTLALSPLRLSVQELSLNHSGLGDLGMAAACAFVRPWSGRCMFMRMRECSLGDDGASAVARLSCGPAGEVLRELCLSANQIGDKGAAALAEALPTCDALERLLLDRNRIGPTGAKALALRLPRSSVAELVLGSHLGGNPIGEAGATAIAAALNDQLPRAAANRAMRLEALALDDCCVGKGGAKALANMLPASNLVALSLARDLVGNEGGVEIVKALPPCLMSLDLSDNGLGDRVANAVGEAFYKSADLSVALGQNPISPGLRDLLSAEHGKRLRL
eukprot:gnl/TRDRNA2_/TRDRNA2_35381_c0_seq1.p1 gnl/TRDRNA2_/TRDRNA2_35381_c0~~gnl/TRDRNA2_/TRDRNA2_35381_c0_seq1.p1  ORF type:complete len:621 (+),score=92.24 gnl/TRDRNA2_/TRDRNA2_35381_c0_seq1:106-1968(+)